MLTISVDVKKMHCLFVGGGTIAERRIVKVLEAGGVVHVISPTITPVIAEFVKKGVVTWTKSPYIPGKLPHANLVWITTADATVNEEASEEAKKKGALVNRADKVEESTFTMPATVILGELECFISTGGASPRLNRLLREDMEARYSSIQAIIPSLRRLRDEVKKCIPLQKERESFWKQYLTIDDVTLILKGKHQVVEEKLQHAVHSIRIKS